ncbi:MAG: PQQ-binding-like beta-propeller repeat protein [Myxococcales bacterium]|nr:PQQ-binding-like beta-propeller repeat protein [Myxococcales bacterium]
MLRTRWLAVVGVTVLAGCGGGRAHRGELTQVGDPPPTKAGAAGATDAGTGAPQPPPGDDVGAEMDAMTTAAFAQPATSFRPGHVSKRAAPKAARTRSGFEIQFPSRATITTPAVYDGRVYVSGGFKSKEFYAFEATSGKAAWALDLDDDGPSTAACAERTCVINTESCTVFALDARTGEQLWAWWLGDPLTSSPTIAGGLVFTSYPVQAVDDAAKERPPHATHALAAFELRTGALVWQRWLDADVMSSPVAAGEFLYVSTFNGTLMKLEPATGKLRYAVRGQATSAPVVQFVGGRESMFYTSRVDFADDPLEGALRAPAEMIIRTDDNHPKTRYTTAQKKADYIDAAKQAGSTYADTGKSQDAHNGFSGGAPASANAPAAAAMIGQGSVSTMQAFQGSRILNLGATNVNTMGDEVIATNAENGERLWSVKLEGDVTKDGGFLGTAPAAAGGRVLVATLKGEVLELEPGSGKVARKHAVGAPVRSQPVAVDGWIYVGTEDGRLVAIDTKDRSLTGWPMWGGNAARTGIATAP